MVERRRVKREQVGWFVWVCINGKYTFAKWSIQAYPSYKESLARHQAIEVQKDALDEDDWKRSLDGLASVKYSLRAKEPADAPQPSHAG